MKLTDLLKITTSKEEALEYLKEKGILRDFEKCPFCNCSNIAKVRRNKLLCVEHPASYLRLCSYQKQ